VYRPATARPKITYDTNVFNIFVTFSFFLNIFERVFHLYLFIAARSLQLSLVHVSTARSIA